MTDKLQEMKKLADGKLEAEKDKVNARRNEKKLQAEIDKARELVKQDFSGFDPYFSFGIFTQLSSLKCGKYDDVDDAMKLLFERSILKTVTPGNQIEMMLVTQLISIHEATMNSARLLALSKTREEVESYGNVLNKLSRTFATQTDALQRLRSGPEPKYHVSVNEGAQAIVGPVTHNTTVGTNQPGATTAPRLLADQSGTAMSIYEPVDDAVTTVPLIKQDQEAAQIATGRRRRK